MKHLEYPRIGESCYEQRLSNGMLIRVVPKRGFARKYAFVAVDFGAIDTAFRKDGVSVRTPDGIAHYLEHKMFDLPEGSADSMFAALGASPNAFTSYAMTAYHFSCTENFTDNLRILLRMVTTPHFTPESVEKERGIITQEI
ncbi:MAG: insulinase family protein, partial [Clostridiales bacterium]|nr:insulinase family protein [Clostridiales bacterium]